MLSKSLFAPGQICYPDEVQAVLRQAGLHGITLIGRHIRGEWGHVDEKRRRVNRWAISHPQDERRLPVISRFALPDDRQVAVITRYVHTPAQRQTHLCLWPPQAVKKPAENGDTEQRAKKAQLARKRKKRQEVKE